MHFVILLQGLDLANDGGRFFPARVEFSEIDVTTYDNMSVLEKLHA